MSSEVQAGLSLRPMGTEPPPDRELLCVFGTGDLGRSLGQRLLQTGYRVVYGSRRPAGCGPLPPGAQVGTGSPRYSSHLYELTDRNNVVCMCVRMSVCLFRF